MKQVFFEWENTAALNQERFTLATDDTIEGLRNGVKKYEYSKKASFWLSMWKLWCKGKRISLEIEEYETAELNRLLEKFYAEAKNKYTSRHFLHAIFFIFILLISNHTVFLVEFQLFEKQTRASNFRIEREISYDYQYKLFAFMSGMFKATKHSTV